MKLKILLTGSNGFLGRFLFKELSKQNSIFTLNRKNSNYNFDLEKDNFVLQENFDLVVHSSGKAHVIPKNTQEILSFYKTNVNGTISLLNSFQNSTRPKYFVFISSVSVYGLNEGNLINEDNPLIAVDPYGLSKIKAEEIVKKWCDEYNVICTILRLPLVVGENPPGNLGAMIRGIKRGYYFNIAGGKAQKSMVLATDVARFILKAAKIGGTYNLTDGIHPTFYDLSRSIASQLGIHFVPNLPNFFAIILAKFGDIFGNRFPINSAKLLKISSTLTFDDTKARTAFGWNPSSVLNDFKINNDVY